MKLRPTTFTVTFDGFPIEICELVECLYAVDSRRWKIYRQGETLNEKTEWEREPQPSSRTEEYLNANRYSWEKAQHTLLIYENLERNDDEI